MGSAEALKLGRPVRSAGKVGRRVAVSSKIGWPREASLRQGLSKDPQEVVSEHVAVWGKSIPGSRDSTGC